MWFWSLGGVRFESEVEGFYFWIEEMRMGEEKLGYYDKGDNVNGVGYDYGIKEIFWFIWGF